MTPGSWLDLCYDALGVAEDVPEQDRRRRAEHALLTATGQPIDILGIGAAEAAIDLVVRYGEAGRLDEVMLCWEQAEFLAPEVAALSDEGNRRATLCAKKLLHCVVSWLEVQPGGDEGKGSAVDLVELYRRAVEDFGGRVQAVGGEQWHLPTPCSDWDVRQLVNHVLGENAWAVPLLEGNTIDEVGDRLDGDLLGEDPGAAWARAAAAATAAAGEDGVMERVVHVSFGDIPGREYLSQLTTDHLIHAWDLARAVAGDERLDPELVEFVNGYLEPNAEQWRAAGAFGARVDPAPDADAQARLLGLTGRRT